MNISRGQTFYARGSNPIMKTSQCCDAKIAANWPPLPWRRILGSGWVAAVGIASVVVTVSVWELRNTCSVVWSCYTQSEGGNVAAHLSEEKRRIGEPFLMPQTERSLVVHGILSRFLKAFITRGVRIIICTVQLRMAASACLLNIKICIVFWWDRWLDWL